MSRLKKVLVILTAGGEPHSFVSNLDGAKALYGAVIDNPFATVKCFTYCLTCHNSFIKDNGANCYDCEDPKEIDLVDRKK